MKLFSTPAAPEKFTNEDQKINKHINCTFEWNLAPSQVFFPENLEELITISTMASDQNVKLEIMSSGKNWGFGSGCIGSENAAIVNLEKMNAIKFVDPVLGVARIEAGVTFRQLHEYLKIHNINFWIDPIGAGPDISITGNFLQKGHGLTNYGDHIFHLISLKAIYGRGQKINTSAADNIYDPCPLGPDIKGLFSQSEKGIVYEVDIALMPIPAFHEMVVVQINYDRLKETVDHLAELKMKKFFNSTLLIANDYRQLLSLEPISKSVAGHTKELKKKHKLKDWVFIFSLYEEDTAIMQSKLSYLKKIIPEMESISKMSECKNEYINSIFKLSQGSLVEPSKRLYRENHKYKKNQIFEVNYDLHKCGFYWLTATIANTGSELFKFSKLVQDFLKLNNVEFELNYFVKRDRVIHAHIGLHFDRGNPSKAKLARTTYKDLSILLLKNGFPPHRKGIQDS